MASEHVTPKRVDTRRTGPHAVYWYKAVVEETENGYWSEDGRGDEGGDGSIIL